MFHNVQSYENEKIQWDLAASLKFSFNGVNADCRGTSRVEWEQGIKFGQNKNMYVKKNKKIQ